jgi:hypothetical protein
MNTYTTERYVDTSVAVRRGPNGSVAVVWGEEVCVWVWTAFVGCVTLSKHIIAARQTTNTGNERDTAT